MDPIYPSKTGAYAYTRKAVVARGINAKKWLKERPEKVIAVVSHSAFMRTAVVRSRFANADWRVFEFEDGKWESSDESEGVDLVEWELTEERGGGMGRSMKGYMAIEEGDFPDAEDELAEVSNKGEDENK